MFKRDLKLFVKCLAAAAVMTMILALVCTLAAGAMILESDSSSTINVAVVDNEDSAVSRILINAVAKTDYLSGLLTAKSMSEDAAMESLSCGDSAAAIILYDGFIDDIMDGSSAGGRVYLSERAAAQGEIIGSSVKFGEYLLAAGQYGVFAGSRLLREHGVDDETRLGYVARMNTRLLSEALAANDKYFTFEELDFDGTGLTTADYYITCALTLLLFLSVLFFIPLLTRDCTREMLTRLRVYGIDSVRFMAGKLFLLFAMRIVLLAASLAVLGMAAGYAVDASAAIYALACCAYITLVSSCLTMCFGDGITPNVICAMLGMFLCGGLVPRQLLPDIASALGDITPFGAARSLLAPIFGAPINTISIVFALIYAAAAVYLIRARLERILCGRS